MNILFIRGAFLNRFEGQNIEPFYPKLNILGIGSLTSIHKNFTFPVKQFLSLYDLTQPFGPFSGRYRRAFLNRAFGDSHFLIGLENYVKSSKKGYFDIAHIAETYFGYDLQIIKLKQEGFIRKVISTCWETIPFNNESIYKKKRLKYFVRANIDHFICPTEKAKKALLVEGVNSKKINVIRIGVDLNKFRPKLSKNLTSRNFTILFVGRLVEEKGILDLYEAFKKVKQEISNVKLRVVGDGYLKSILTIKLQRDGLKSSVSIEQKSYNEMPEVYQSADLLVVPSKTTKTWEEQYGMVIVEAMASAVPVVAYDTGAIKELIKDQVCAVPEGDINQLVRKIIQVIKNENICRTVSKNNRSKAVAYFDSSKIAKEYKRLYMSLI